MSGTSTPVSSSVHLPASRTLAIIKPHALKNRFDIESRISSSGFEIIKERQMGFMDSDPSVHALFGDDAPTLSGEPVWVYVLERRRAVEVWNSLIGPADPELAREISPDSIRAVFGVTLSENAVYGSPDADAAELQIASLFASSPPFPPVELHDEIPDNPLHITQSDTDGEGERDRSFRVDIKSKTKGFKARPVPSSTHSPSVQPRITKAAALRAGIEVSQKPRMSATPESIARTFANVPGHKRAMSITVASTAVPAIAPRQTRASSLRISLPEAPKAKGRPRPSTARKPTSPERLEEIFANVPGHKRRETISVASTAAPSISPRPTRASALRTGQPITQSSSKHLPAIAALNITDTRSDLKGGENEKPANANTFEGVPGHKRTISITVPSVRPPSEAPRTNRSAILRQQKMDGQSKGPPSSWGFKDASQPPPSIRSRPASQTSMHVSTNQPASSTTRSTTRSASVEPNQTRPTLASTPRAPSITPRSNKSALLRARVQPPKPGSSAPRVAAF